MRLFIQLFLNFYRILQVKLLSKSLFKVNPGHMTEGFLPLIHYPMQLDNFKDNRLDKNSKLEFTNLTQLFASNNMNHGVIGLTFNMALYL